MEPKDDSEESRERERERERERDEDIKGRTNHGGLNHQNGAKRGRVK